MKKYIAIVILFDLLVSCDDFKNCPEHYYSNDFKSNVMFNPGSYWVYRDSLLDLSDSAYLKSQDFYFREKCNPRGEPADILEQTFSYTTGDSTADYLVYYNAGFNNDQPLGFFGYYTNTCAAFQPYTYSVLDSININGIYYHHITVLSLDNKKYYWSKNVGLIRKEFPIAEDSDTIYHFDLVRYHLN
jgi:hypothetical protein